MASRSSHPRGKARGRVSPALLSARKAAPPALPHAPLHGESSKALSQHQRNGGRGCPACKAGRLPLSRKAGAACGNMRRPGLCAQPAQ